MFALPGNSTLEALKPSFKIERTTSKEKAMRMLLRVSIPVESGNAAAAE